MRPVSLLMFVLACALLQVAPRPAAAEDSAWDQIRRELFQDRAIQSDGAAVKLFGPKTAEDAAFVPISIYISAEHVRHARKLTLLVDQNPAPVVAVFNFGEAYRAGADGSDRMIETRVRLDQMSPVRAVLETDDEKLYEASQFVSGAGGCSSSSIKDLDQALKGLGQLKLKISADPTRGPDWRLAQVQIRHPNFSGMQIDADTNGYTPAHYVDRVDLTAGGVSLVSIETSIGVSEDPHFRLSYSALKDETITLNVKDSKDQAYQTSTASQSHQKSD